MRLSKMSPTCINMNVMVYLSYCHRVEDVISRLSSLDSRLDEASSVNEDQVMTAVESNLDDLEVWLVTSGNFSNNQQILVQVEEHKVCWLSILRAHFLLGS